MKLQYLGTAAAEGVPALWCSCENCKKSREDGGRSIRTRSQAIIDGQLMIDYPADAYSHILNNNIDMCDVKWIIFTHSHDDHMYERDFHMLKKGYSKPRENYHLDIYASKAAAQKMIPSLKRTDECFCILHEAREFESITLGKYTVTPLPAFHDEDAGAIIYSVSDGEKSLLYAHDTGLFPDSVWEYFERKRPYFDLVSLDCTNACLEYIGCAHMGIKDNAAVKERMIKLGVANEKTVFIANHFSHNGKNVAYNDFVPIAEKEGFTVSYDGMTVNI